MATSDDLRALLAAVRDADAEDAEHIARGGLRGDDRALNGRRARTALGEAVFAAPVLVECLEAVERLGRARRAVTEAERAPQNAQAFYPLARAELGVALDAVSALADRLHAARKGE